MVVVFIVVVMTFVALNFDALIVVVCVMVAIATDMMVQLLVCLDMRWHEEGRHGREWLFDICLRMYNLRFVCTREGEQKLYK